MGKCALPDHLKDKKHNDWIWPLSYLPRAVNAFGPRCPTDSKSYRPWPPVLIKGHGVSRWETSRATSDLEIPELANCTVDGDYVYNKSWRGIERLEGHVDFGKEKNIILTKDGEYSPSALQKYSKKGRMLLEPRYVAYWYLLKEEEGEDYFAFYRGGYRPDHVDVYYNWGPMLGFKMD